MQQVSHPGRIFRSLALPGLFACLFQTGLFGQYYETGQDPASLRWNQIKTPHFRLIFPRDYTQEAIRMMDILEYYRVPVTHSLDHSPGRIPVILHTHTAESNGLVAWAPRRMDLFTTPPQNMYPHDWLEQLAVHEYRHVVQVSKLNKGFTRFLSYLGGEQVPGGFSSMLGSWFLEGDAVYAETLLSPSGRGRLPQFEMGLRSQSLEGDRFYRFDEAVLGSYKRYIPDYYEYGYQMVAYGRWKYGNEIWKRSIDYVGKYPFLLNPVYFSLRREGLSKRKLFDQTFEELGERWDRQYRAGHYTPFRPLSPGPGKWYTSYRFPQLVLDSVLVAEKSGIDQVDAFVLIYPDGREKKIHVPGNTQSVRLSGKGRRLVWSELLPDAIWSNRQYSVIRVLDIPTGRVSQLSFKSRLFAPALSNRSDRIVAVESSEQNDYALVLLDAISGNLIDSFPSPGNRFLMMPEWDEADASVYVITMEERGKGIYRLELQNREWVPVLEPGPDDILSLAPGGNYLFYHSSRSGIDNLYALELQTGKNYRVTSSRYGAFDPLVDAKTNRIIYSDYSSQGYRLVAATLDPRSWEPVEELENNFQGFAPKLEELEPDLSSGEMIPRGTYPVKPYRKVWNLFRFHSWMPFYFDLDQFRLDDPNISPGLTLLSQDLLSTAVTELAYAYRDGHHYFQSKFTYKGIFPVIDLSYRYGGPVSLIKPNQVDYSGDFPTTSHTVTGTLTAPLNLTRNRFFSALIPSAEFSLYNDIYYNLSTRMFEQDLVTSQLRLYYYRILKTSPRDLYPRWGGIFDITSLSVPGKEESFNPSFKLKTALFFPGFFRHQGLRLEGSYQEQNLEKYAFIVNQEFPRGYEQQFSEQLLAFRSDYVFPLLYPDLDIPGFLYIKRLKGSLFYDYARNYYRQYNQTTSSYEGITRNLVSLGGTLSFDLHLLRTPYAINAGARFSYLPLLNKPVLESIFSVNIYGFSINRF